MSEEKAPAPAKEKKKKKLKSEFYDAKGESLERKAKFCPKCGAGIFLAEHKDRSTCGKCGYTEMKGSEKTEQGAPNS